ncbi:MAG: nuclear transport factor 2 family protein [Salinimicrobium sp.]
MIKRAAFLLLLIGSISMSAQEASEEAAVKNAIDTFFKGFHARDSIVMKSVLTDATVVQTVAKDKSGEVVLTTDDLHKMLKGIVGIPLKTTFKEELHSYDIEIDGALAQAWTPYSLYVNEEFVHCGVDSFQLFKDNGKWKIIYLVDTRRKEGCEDIARK